MYRPVMQLAKGMMLIAGPRGNQMWVRARTTYKHNKTPCAICGRFVGSQAYRPFGNPFNRYLRICVDHELPVETPDDTSGSF
jgi:hypothetical protein